MKTSTTILFVATLATLIGATARAEWTIDLSRRNSQMRQQELNPNARSSGRSPASVRTFEGEEPEPQEVSASETIAPANVAADRAQPGFVDRILEPGEPSQDIVILNTERGFVPNTIRVRKDARYTVHIVNVNEKEKNVSFILDGFSEHHATFFGKVKSFRLEPRKEGVFSFLSPETAVEGKFIVYASGPPSLRAPATAQVNPLGNE